MVQNIGHGTLIARIFSEGDQYFAPCVPYFTYVRDIKHIIKTV